MMEFEKDWIIIPTIGEIKAMFHTTNQICRPGVAPQMATPEEHCLDCRDA
jgi:hypothetical protein